MISMYYQNHSISTKSHVICVNCSAMLESSEAYVSMPIYAFVIV